MALTLGIDVAVQAEHQATLARDGATIWRGRKFWTRLADLERLWANLDLPDDGVTCRNPYSYPEPAAIASDLEELSRADAEASGCATGGCLEAYRACRDGLVSGDGCAY